MKRFLSIAMALCIGLTMSLDANAKRFGGGKSAGAAPALLPPPKRLAFASMLIVKPMHNAMAMLRKRFIRGSHLWISRAPCCTDEL